MREQVVRIEIALEQDDGGKTVDGGLSIAVGDAASAEGAFGFAAGEALIPHLDGQAKFGFEDDRELAGPGGLSALFAVHTFGIAEQDAVYVVGDDDAGEFFQIRTEIAADEGG